MSQQQQPPAQTSFSTNTPVWFSFKEFSKRLDDTLPVYLEAVVGGQDTKDSSRYLIRFPSLMKSSSSDSINSEIARLPSPVEDMFSVPAFLLDLRSDNIEHDQYLHMNDLVQLPNLNEPELLKAIGHRYMADKIFSYVGPTLLVVNPYKKIANLFSDSVQSYFEQLVLSKADDIASTSPPHIFAIAAQSIQSIMNKRSTKQAIVISGESGAGKTENTKYAMNFLTHINAIIDSKRRKPQQQQLLLNGSSNRLSTRPSDITIEKRILNCNPILEAFGNAKTTRNDNSSRFGKLVIFHFGNEKHHDANSSNLMTIQSATLTNYLLEKSRIVRIQPQERNYHVFYFLLAGASQEFLHSLGLQSNNPTYYKYLRSDCPKVDRLADSDLFEEVQESLYDLSFSETEQSAIWSIVSAVLLLGNLEFKQESEQLESVVISQSIEAARITEEIIMKLGCTQTQFIEALTKKRIEVNKQITMSPLKLQEVLENRDSLSKYLYDSLFQFIVRRLNESIAPASAAETSVASIEILDIFGFEVFAENSFEQLCINFANEKLQQLYIKYIYEGEKQLFRSQNLAQYLTEIVYTDNKMIIDALERMREQPIGVFPLIDEASSIIQGTDVGLIATIKKQHQSVSSCLTFSQRAPLRFAVNHSAGSVEYTITDFRAKNKDEVSQMLQNLVQNQELVKIFKNSSSTENNNNNTNSAQKSLGSKFRTQMKSLMDELQSCECQFVRCIKPNALKQPNLVETRYSLNQINCLGVLETIRVRKQGYSYRAPYTRFYYDHWQLSPPQKIFPNSIGVVESFPKETIMQLVKKLISRWVPASDIESKNLLLGDTLVLMRQSLVNHLLSKQQKIKDDISNKSKVIQRYYRAYRIRKALKHIRRIKSMLITMIFRFRFLRTDQMKKLMEQRRARESEAKIQEHIKRIQRYFRRYLQRKQEAIQSAAMKILLAYQTYKHRQAQKIRLEATQAFIKSKILMLKCRRTYLNMLKKIILIQSIYRGYSTRKQTVVLKTIMSAIHLAWDRIRYNSSIIINSTIRMYLVKLKQSDIVKAIKAAGNRVRTRKAILIIQRYRRYVQFRRALNYKRNAASKIQAYFRMRWCSFVYQLIRRSVVKIQRQARTWLQEKCYLAEKWVHRFNWNAVKRDALYSQQNLVGLGIAFNTQAKVLSTQQMNLISAAMITNPAMIQLKKHYEDVYANQLRIKGDTGTSMNKQTIQSSYSSLQSVVLPVNLSSQQHQVNNSTIKQSSQAYVSTLGKLQNGDSELQMKLKEYERQRERVQTVMRLDADQVPLQTLIVDLDQLPSSHEVYSSQRWAHTYNSIEAALKVQQAKVLQILISEVSTTIVSDKSTISTFGSIFDENNDNNNKLDPLKNVNTFYLPNLESVFSGNSGQIIVKSIDSTSKQTQLYCWGDNSADDLLVGEHTEMFINSPQQMQCEFASIISIIEQEKLTKSFKYLLADGDVITNSKQQNNTNSLIRITLNVEIVSVSCGGSFTLFLTSLGLIYASGKNSSGELGMNDRKARESPQEIVSFRRLGEKITSIACGLKHALCVSSLGKVFAWGNNRFGQLGVGDTKNRLQPERVALQVDKMLANSSALTWTVKATMRASICAAMGFNETRTILWWGTNGNLQVQVKPVPLDINNYFPDSIKAKDFVPLKVMTSWSQNLSVTYIIGADLQHTAPNKRHALLKHLAVLSKAWHPNKVFPPMQKSLDKLAEIAQVKQKQQFKGNMRSNMSNTNSFNQSMQFSLK